MKKEGIGGYSPGYGKGEITLGKLVFYNLLFFIPLALAIIGASLISKLIYSRLETTSMVASQIIMLFFTLGIFLLIIPFIRRRESVAGVRYALIGFLIVAIGLTLPSIVIQKRLDLLIMELPHIATYVLLTFIYCPEVLGMDIDISKWFKHYKQLLIIFIYCSILLLYVAGFGGIYHDIALSDAGAFSHSASKEPSYTRYLYFSTITFTTIGYGDITPVSAVARLLVGIEAIVGAIVNVIFIAILFLYISNFQAFLQGLQEEGKRIRADEARISRLEKGGKRKKGRIKKGLSRLKGKR